MKKPSESLSSMPRPVEFVCWSVAASTLSFMKPGGGRCHFGRSKAVEGGDRLKWIVDHASRWEMDSTAFAQSGQVSLTSTLLARRSTQRLAASYLGIGDTNMPLFVGRVWLLGDIPARALGKNPPGNRREYSEYYRSEVRTLWLFLVRSVGHSTIDDSAAIAGAEILLLINRSNVACLISLRAWRFGVNNQTIYFKSVKHRAE
nr:hypothetical protein Iba_chr08aCG8190 [Ipomoea batatas]